MNKTALIIGAGCAGLTAAYELLTKTDIKPIIVEATNVIGGLARNGYLDENIIDIGGHRFFSKDKIVNDMWQKFMPLQGKETFESKINGWSTKLNPVGPDPETYDNVLLMRNRNSRIYYLNHFYNYPLSINFGTIKQLGFKRAFRAGCSYFKSVFIKRKEINLENFYINRFGKNLYKTFFEDYTEKLWGVHPRDIPADWGKQRVKSLSLSKAILNSIKKPFIKDNQKVEASLVGSFSYPKLGPGSMYEVMADWCEKHGAIIIKNSKITEISIKNNKIDYVMINNKEKMKCDYIISSMPLKDLINAINRDSVPNEIFKIANNLKYRNLINVNVLLKDLKLHNRTKIKTLNNRLIDNWLYIQQKDCRVSRIQILNNWSPYLVKDNVNNTFLGLEMFSEDNDELSKLKDNELRDIAINDIIKIGLIEKKDIIKTKVIRLDKAYPSYFGDYKYINKVTSYLNNITNLFCVGRNGQHRYNNMDHSILTSIYAVECIINGTDKNAIWKVNTEQEYLENVK